MYQAQLIQITNERYIMSLVLLAEKDVLCMVEGLVISNLYTRAIRLDVSFFLLRCV